MFFEASKIGWFFATPSNFLVFLLGLSAFFAVMRFPYLSRLCFALSFIGLLICGFSPAGNLLILPLEERFPAWTGAQMPTGIIVLGGSSETATTRERGQVSLNESAERMTEAVILARRYPTAKIIFTGGDGGFLGGAGNEADDAQAFFSRLGLPPSQFILERDSRNTHENASMTATLAKPKPGEIWLLVTSAFHMPRAIGCFRKAGFAITPYPVDYRTRGPGDALRFFPSLSEGLRRFDVAVREWLGLIVYYNLGFTSELFPAAQTSEVK